jgi:hypothetical protein
MVSTGLAFFVQQRQYFPKVLMFPIGIAVAIGGYSWDLAYGRGSARLTQKAKSLYESEVANNNNNNNNNNSNNSS